MNENHPGVDETGQDLDSTPEEEQTTKTSNVGETSVEINVEELIAELETESDRPGSNGHDARRRLEELLEERRIARELEELEEYDA